MDSEYLQNALWKYMRLICGEDNKKTVFAVEVGDKFVIGYEINGVRHVSRITRQIAICLAMGLNTYMTLHQEKIKPKRIRTK